MKKELWNRSWTFWKESNAFALIPSIPQDARIVDLPHDPMFLQEQDPDCLSEGKQGFLPGGTWKYYKEYDAPSEDRNIITKLLFEGASQITAVYVNDSCVAKHVYSFSEFYVDLTPYLHYGSKNRILVTATVPENSFRFYVGGGLFRDVSIVKEPMTGFVPESLKVTTKALSESECAQSEGISAGTDASEPAGVSSCGQDAEVSVSVQFQNRLLTNFQGVYRIAVSERDGKDIFSGSWRIHLEAGKTQELTKQLFLPGIVPWDDRHPALYKVSVSLSGEREDPVDSDDTLTGFRVISLDPKRGLRVNGREIKLLGGCVHADQGLLGGATYASYEYRRMLAHKKNGFNAVRCAHNPASKALLRACDELGIYVLDEATDIWGKMKNTQDYSMFFEKDIDDVMEMMVRVDYNHPSVLMYSTGNEIMDIATDKGYELTMRFTEMLHRLDPTRFVTNAVNALLVTGPLLAENAREVGEGLIDPEKRIDVNEFMANGFMDVGKIISIPPVTRMLELIDTAVDVSGYNYMISRYEEDAVNYPNRIILGTETHSKRIPDHYEAMKKHHNIIGDFIWCSHTYLGENGGADNFPYIMNESADLTVIGDPKPCCYYRAIALGIRKAPYIAVRTPEKSQNVMRTGPWVLTDAIDCWDFPGHEGEECDVEVYYAGDSLELFLNGRFLGNGTPDPEQPGRVTYRVPYEPGELCAVSETGTGKETYCLKTKGAGEVIDLQPEENPFAAKDGLCYVNVTIRNREGEAVHAFVPDLTVSLKGEAVSLLAFGGQRSSHAGGFTKSTTDIHDGRALIILKKTGEGKGTLRVSGSGLQVAEMEI